MITNDLFPVTEPRKEGGRTPQLTKAASWIPTTRLSFLTLLNYLPQTSSTQRKTMKDETTQLVSVDVVIVNHPHQVRPKNNITLMKKLSEADKIVKNHSISF